MLLLNIPCHNGEMMDEGIAYLGPIMMWWDMNDNGPSFAILSCQDGAPIGDVN